jgi:signal transduction histidine kinase
VVRNVLANAIKFSNEGGLIELGLSCSATEVKIVIRDYGKGITDEAISAIKNRTIQNPQYGTSGEKGSGLGILLCSELLELIGGSLHYTKEERGTLALICLEKLST